MHTEQIKAIPLFLDSFKFTQNFNIKIGAVVICAAIIFFFDELQLLFP